MAACFIASKKQPAATWCYCSRRGDKTPQAARWESWCRTKVHKRAVRRHQLKRWVREWFRRNGKEPAHGFDMVVLFRADPPKDGHQLLDKELKRLLQKALQAQPDPGKGRGRKKASKNSRLTS